MKKFNNDYLNKALEVLGFKKLTEVQERVFELFELNKDLIIEAKTGSGKTHAFLLPILDNLKPDINRVQAVIVAPTRELANQIYRFTNELVKFSKNTIPVELYTGGTDKENDLTYLTSKQPTIVIATPGRLHDLVIKENILKIFNTDYFIIDEADMTLDNNFLEILDNLAKTVQKAKFMVFSATIPLKIRPFLKKYLNNPLMVSVHPDEISNLNIEHTFIKTKERDKFGVLEQVINVINPYLAIIFCNTKETANSLFDYLASKGLNITLIHGDIDFRKRKQLIKRINNLDFQYIVATDILARGIDIIGVSHVINYELPRDPEFYIHRSGRTGRINFDGKCISLYDFEDNTYLDILEAKGIVSQHKAIKNNQLTEINQRNKRQKRVRPENELDYQAKAKVRKPKKVKPGYKKKYNQKVEKEKKILSRKRK